MVIGIGILASVTGLVSTGITVRKTSVKSDVTLETKNIGKLRKNSLVYIDSTVASGEEFNVAKDNEDEKAGTKE